MRTDWRIVAFIVFGSLAVYQRWPAWSCVAVGLFLLIDPRARWDELLEAIKSRKPEPVADPEPVQPSRRRDFGIPVRVTDTAVFADPCSPNRRVVFIKPASIKTESEICKCGNPGCIGHEVINGEAVFPGFTSAAVMHSGGRKLVRFNVEITGVEAITD